MAVTVDLFYWTVLAFAILNAVAMVSLAIIGGVALRTMRIMTDNLYHSAPVPTGTNINHGVAHPALMSEPARGSEPE